MPTSGQGHPLAGLPHAHQATIRRVQAHVLVDNALPCLLSAYASYVTRIESDYFLSPNLRLLLRVFALPAFKI